MANKCKYYKQHELVSYDGGTTWSETGQYRQGDLIQYESPDCSEPTPTFDGKFRATYTGGQTYSVACDSSTELTSGDTRPNGYNYTAMTSAEIGCVTSVGYMAFAYCSGLTSVTFSSAVTSIDYGAFAHCTGLTSVVIPSGVTSIGGEAFFDCRNLASVTVNATTPPTLGNIYVFEDTLMVGGGNGYIYVPSASVDAYKSETRWSTYASRIRPIT